MDNRIAKETMATEGVDVQIDINSGNGIQKYICHYHYYNSNIILKTTQNVCKENLREPNS